MPVVFVYRGRRFFFFSNEGNPREPVHIHVRQGERLAKSWVIPVATVAESHGFSARELNHLAAVVDRHRPLIERRWHEHFGG